MRFLRLLIAFSFGEYSCTEIGLQGSCIGVCCANTDVIDKINSNIKSDVLIGLKVKASKSLSFLDALCYLK